MYINISSNFSTTYYLRNFYSSNRSAAKTPSYRNNASNHTLLLADSEAVTKASKKLASLDYSTSSATNGGDIFHGISAFVTSYNNLIDSSKNSGHNYVSKRKSSLKALTKSHTDELAEMGITIDSKGKLKINEKTLSTASLNKIKKMFSSSGTYCSSVQKLAKEINRYEKKHIPVMHAPAEDTSSGTSTLAVSDPSSSPAGSSIDVSV